MDRAHGRGTFLVAGLANGLRALPTLGLLILAVLLIAPLISNDLAFVIPSLIALVVLGVPPVLSGTYSGIQNVDPAARDAAYGMGMSGRQVLWRVELPCALPLVFSGVRSALLQIIATATIAAYVSLGGLGRFIIDGQAQHDFPQMLSGAVLVAALALLADLVISVVQRLTVSRGLTGRYRRTVASTPEAVEAVAPGGPGGDRDRVTQRRLSTAPATAVPAAADSPSGPLAPTRRRDPHWRAAMKRIRLALVAGLAGALALAGCGSSNALSPTPRRRRPSPAPSSSARRTSPRTSSSPRSTPRRCRARGSPSRPG